MEWKESMKTGMPDIDEMYQRTMVSVSAILRDMNMSRSIVDTQSNIERIKKEFIELFSYQESLMIMNKYPQYYQHKHHHEQFIDSLDGFIKKANDDYYGSSAFTVEKVIDDWIMKHIFMYDKLYAKFVGVK